MQKNIVTECLVAGIFISLFAVFAPAQEKTAMSADQTLRSNAKVNPSTLGMELSIPLASYPGRGPGASVSLSYSSKLWRLADAGIHQPVNSQLCISLATPQYGELSASGWTASTAVPYIEYTGRENIYWADGTVMNVPIPGCEGQQQNANGYYVRRITVHMPGGGSHELRADDSPIAFEPGNQNDPFWPTNQANWNTTYYAADGSNLRYVEDSTTGTYRLLLTDGSHIDFGGTLETLNTFDISRTIRKATELKDNHGNTITYHAPDTNHPNGYQTDTLGREIATPVGLEPPANPTSSASPQAYSVPGFGTGSLTYYLHWKRLKGATAGESALTNFSDTLCYKAAGMPGGPPSQGCGLFSHTIDDGKYFWAVAPAEDGEFNPVVLARIDLPNGASYKFGYDIYGRINKIDYPTGASEAFTYSAVPVLAQMNYPASDFHKQANFGVTNRKVYPEGVGSYYEWAYSAAYAAANAYKVSVTSPDGTLSERLIHRDKPSNYCAEGCGGGSFGFDNPLAGMAYEELSYDSGNPRKLLSRQLTTWTSTTFAQQGTGNPSWHPRVTKVESIVCDPLTTACLSSTATTGYVGTLSQITDAVNPNLVTQYGFSTVIGTLGPLEKTVETTYRTDTAFTDRNMRSLPDVVVTKDAGGIVRAKSQVFYDDADYGVSGVYGLPTRTRSWHDVANDLYIEAKAKYDAYGNVIESTDGRGNVTQTEYSSAYSYAYPTKVTTPVPDDNGTYGSDAPLATLTAYDLATGLPTSTTDANGQTTTMSYADPVTGVIDPLLRVRKVTAPNGHQTITEYGTPDASGQLPASQRFVKTRSQIDDTKWSEGLTWFDGLGRAWKSEEVNANGNIFVEKEFDAEGRVKRVTNPFRAGETKYWTTNVYDEASRVKQVTLQDGATVKTDYGVSTTAPIGVTKQITDQAGKKRKGITDALGRMIRVIEDPTGQNLATDYVFDTLGNLRKTTQGVQSRYFMHDSLGRLLYAKQPEQDTNDAFVATDPVTGNTSWSVKYQYDDNSNIFSTTDARNVSVTATYDNLNRLTLRDYSDTTPDVSFYYDGKYLDANDNPQTATGSVKGKATGVKSSVSRTNYTSFDNMGRLLTHQQITDGQTYSTAYTYNLSGALIEETYPSTRVVKYTLDQNGDLSQVLSKKTANHGYFSYVDSFSFDSAGAVKKMQLGNGLWETAEYNERLQIKQIGLGETNSVQDILKLELGYGTSAQNNGSLREQKITVPNSTGGNGFTAIQTYAYDDLNRLQSATETIGGAETWKQTFIIDRYGNRRFDAANTTTLGSCPTAVCNPDINSSDNRFASGQGYSFDANGSVTQDANGQRFAYDAESHQKEFFVAGNFSSNPDATYLYDGEGRRVKKISAAETTIFVYDASGQLVAEYSTAVAPAETAQVSYLTTDHLGSPRVVTDKNGVVIDRKDYSAFGEESVSAQRSANTEYTAADQLRKNYTGYEKDGESGLEFAQARYYNPSHGRYTSVDPLTASASIRNPQTFNRYSYVLNSPYKFTDPLGLAPKLSELKSKVLDAINGKGTLTDEELALAKFHIQNGTALGYAFLNASYTEIARQNQRSQTSDPPQTIQVTRVTLLDDGGTSIKSLRNCGSQKGAGCLTLYDEISGIWEFDISTLIGPDTTRETFKVKVEFIVVDTKGFEGFAAEGKGTSVDVPKNGRYGLSSLAGQEPVDFDLDSGSSGSVTIALRAPKSKNENTNWALRIHIRANYSYTDLYKRETGFQRSESRSTTFRLRLVYGNKDGHPPRKNPY